MKQIRELMYAEMKYPQGRWQIGMGDAALYSLLATFLSGKQFDPMRLMPKEKEKDPDAEIMAQFGIRRKEET